LAIDKIENLRESEALIKKAQGKLFDGKRGGKSRVRVLLTAFLDDLLVTSQS
jgi:PleD family two-component response regulator